MFPRAPKFLHGVLIAECLLRNSKFRQRSRGEVSAGTPVGRTEVERCFSSTRQIPHTDTDTHTHSELYNRTELSPVYREFRHLFDKIHSTCLSHPTYTLLCHSLKHPHSSENKQSKEVSWAHPSFSLFPSTHTHAVRLHTHRKALALSRKLAPIKRKKENHYVLYREQTVVVLSTHIFLHGCILVWYCCSVQDKLQYTEEPS